MFEEIEVSKYQRLESVLEDKQQFGFYITKYDSFHMRKEEYRIDINSSIDELKKVHISIYETNSKVDLHCVGDGSTHHGIIAKDINNLEDCIVSVIDKWNCCWSN